MPVLIKGSGGAQEAPTINVSSSGLITATAGDEKTTKQLSTQAAKTVMPGAYEQAVIASDKYTTGEVTVAGVTLQYERVAGLLDGSTSVLLSHSDGWVPISVDDKIFCVMGDAFSSDMTRIGTLYGCDNNGNLSSCNVGYVSEGGRLPYGTVNLSLAVSTDEGIVLSGEGLMTIYSWGIVDIGIDVLYIQ